MDTKSKSSKMVWAWLLRFMLYAFVVAGVHAFLVTYDIGSHFNSRYQLLLDLNPARPAEQSYFVEAEAKTLFGHLKNLAMYDHEDDTGLHQTLLAEGDRIMYYAKNSVTGKEYTNIPDWHGETPPGEHWLTFFFHNGREDLYRGGARFATRTYGGPDDVYVYEEYDWYESDVQGYYPGSTVGLKAAYRDFAVYMWVSGSFDQTDSNSRLAGQARLVWVYRWCCYVYLAALVILLLLNIGFRRHKKAGGLAVAGVTRRVWLEFKLLGLLAAVLLFALWAETFFNIAVGILTVPFLLILLGLYWTDLRVNKAEVFKHNSFRMVARLWRRYLSKKPYQKRLWWEFAVFLALEVVLLFFSVICFAGRDFEFILFGLFLLSCAGGAVYVYALRYKRLVGSLGRLEDFLSGLKDGQLGRSLAVHESDPLYPLLSNVSNLQDSVTAAVSKATKAERMRIELVTNVSHDLKTPLTSIISYVELLRQMELPGQAQGHVEVLAAKSERLKALIQDLFELAKAASGQSELLLETLDFARLAEQTLSDADIEGDAFKVKLSDRPLWVTGDGAKLSRVLHNLFDNAKKYAMPGTRVYIDAHREQDTVAFEIKNVAGYEMNFDPGDVAERFVRGDASRSTEGSGLGLSIARGFTEACGGTFEVVIDGDVFSVRLRFPYRERAKTPPPEPEWATESPPAKATPPEPAPPNESALSPEPEQSTESPSLDEAIEAAPSEPTPEDESTPLSEPEQPSPPPEEESPAPPSENEDIPGGESPGV